MTDNQKIAQIERYIRYNMTSNDKDKAYVHTRAVMQTWKEDNDYHFTDEDIDAIIMLLSGWSAVIRKAWRIFIVEKEYEPYMLWNAYVKAIVLGQAMFSVDWWREGLKIETRLKERIDKTSDPEMIKMIMIGTDWKSLHTKLKKSVTEIVADEA